MDERLQLLTPSPHQLLLAECGACTARVCAVANARAWVLTKPVGGLVCGWQHGAVQFDLSGFWQSPTQGVLTGWFREVEIPNSAKAQSCSLGAAQPSPSPALFAGTANKTTGSGALLFAQDGATAFKTVQPPTQPATLDSTCGTTLYDGAYVGSSNASIFVVGGSFFYIKPVGFVLRSDDGGATWTNVFNTKMVDLHGVAFGPSGTHGCIIGFYTGGEHGTARYASVGCSSDGGASWSMADTLFAFPKPTTQGLWEAVDIAVLS